MNVLWVLNSHSHVMYYILSILLAKYSEVKVSLKPRKTTAYTTGLAINTMQLTT